MLLEKSGTLSHKMMSFNKAYSLFFKPQGEEFNIQLIQRTINRLLIFKIKTNVEEGSYILAHENNKHKICKKKVSQVEQRQSYPYKEEVIDRDCPCQ